MKNPFRFSLRALPLPAIFAAALLAVSIAPRNAPAAPAAPAPAGADDGAYVGLLPVPAKLTLAEVKDRVAQSFRKFQILDAGDDFVVGHHARGSHTLTLTVRFDTQNIKLYAKPDPAGTRRWIDNYRKTLSQNLHARAR
jgi:hypothetical protein